jgi:hypothetical protein
MIGLANRSTNALLGVFALVVWFAAFFWYFYGFRRMEQKVHDILVWLRLVR